MASPPLLLAVLIVLAGASVEGTRLRHLTRHGDNGDLSSGDNHKTCVPQQAPDAMRLVWTVDSDSDAVPSRCPSSISYGILQHSNGTVNSQVGNAWLSQDGNTYTLTERQMCNGRARRSKFRKTFYTATLSSLVPDTTYQYRIAGDSTVRTFVSKPSAGSRSHVTFVAYGDMGYDKGKKSPMAGITFDAITKEHALRPLDMVLHVGDLSYADGRYKAWDGFMALIQGLAAEVPYMVAIGNHEYAYSGSAENDPSGVTAPYRPDWGNFGSESGGECGSMYAHHFLMPSPSSAVAKRMAAILAATAADDSDADADAVEAVELGKGVEEAGGADDRGKRGRSSAVRRAALETATLQQLQPLVAELSGPATAPQAQQQQQAGAVPDNSPFWYSYDYGIVHFTTLSSEHDVSPGSPQHAWLQADLASVDRCTTPWVVVATHRPMYVVYPHKSNRDVGEHLREYLEDLLLEYRVDLVLSGHVHSYYRSCSVRHEVCMEDSSEGLVHLVLGTGGHELSDVDSQQRLWCRAAATDNGFGHFSIHGEQLKFRFIRSSDSQVVDEFKLWAQVPKEECEGFMSKRRAAGVQLSTAQQAQNNASDASEERQGKKQGKHDIVVDSQPGAKDDGEHSDDGDRRKL